MMDTNYDSEINDTHYLDVPSCCCAFDEKKHDTCTVINTHGCFRSLVEHIGSCKHRVCIACVFHSVST